MATNRTIPLQEPNRWIKRNWWMLVFIALCSAWYVHAMRQKSASHQEMIGRLKSLEHEKALALAQHEELLLQIQSQADPAWVEMVLKRNLGLVPEGQTKVYFHN